MLRIFFLLLLALGGSMMAGAQQPSNDDQQPEQPQAITDPAEYSGYITALNTADPAARKSAFDSFLGRFPKSVMREPVLDLSQNLIVQLDNEQTASLRAQVRMAETRAAMAQAASRNSDNLSRYTQCEFSPFKVEESSERDQCFVREVQTAQENRPVEVAHGISLHIAYKETPFVNFKAERLGNYENNKPLLLESLKYLSAQPDTEAAAPWPFRLNGFEVYGINRKQLSGGVLGVYLLFRDSDQAAITLYLLNTPPEAAKFRTSAEYGALRDQFLKIYTACIGTPAKTAQR